MSPPLRDVALGPRTTLGVGGAARYFWQVESEQELEQAVRWAKLQGLPMRVLGGGSNVVVADTGFAGLVIHVALRGIESFGTDSVELRVGAGEPWHPFVLGSVAEKLQGIECLAGIPGSVGATPIQNVGAYGQDVSQTITQVEAYDIERECWRTFDNRALDFGYRNSFFKSVAPDAFVVTRVHFRLAPGAPPALGYAELEREAQRVREAKGIALLDVADVCNVVLELRRKKSMSVDTQDENHRSCGSFFMNPRVPPELVARVASVVPTESVPRHPEPDGLCKLPAAWLIERAGLTKGVRRGPVGLSTRHSLALVCHDGAGSDDVLRFAHEVQRAVRDKFGITLEPEPVFWGFPSGNHRLPPLPA